MKTLGKLEAVLWSIALPGFSQLLTGQIIKGTLFVLLEFVINMYSNFNSAIMFSFLGEIDDAIQVINFQWLMFYPCLYFFAMWDAYRSAMPEKEELSFLPFVFSAYFVTVGLMYSTRIKLFGTLIGPVFLPMLSLIPGLITGFLIRWIILSIKTSRLQK
ncbi:hypothetical protein ACFFHH_17390 [Cytobacillus solani]|uniref:Uncharacterized protein n=1 Tax=Cytobacillus solani TaxID=1637975 RepID=A0A0Q3SH30_9BACI|nr:hypothetical protein [Cytobacillus solani]KOP81833.1 hypothetical protein AMS60_04640 [Bacillus sp. FJAT-21945]KQL18772.1 hypothetical protein AN957_09415 [Cytobacillus solani]USK56754.1 hypothetical protein LIS82_09890 [Cytobacillus solani]